MPRLRYEMFPILIRCIAVAFGLRKRELWAQQWNWVVPVVVCLAMLVPLSSAKRAVISPIRSQTL